MCRSSRANGDRVANELGGRNCVTGEMGKNKLPSRLDLDSTISDDIDWQCMHYTGRGVRKLHESGTTLAESMEALVSKMPDSIEAHCQASLKSAKNPDGEPYPAFASEKSWNEASGKTGSEKKFYHNVSSGADFAAQPFCVAEYVEPAPVTTRTVAHRQVPHIQRVQKMVEVPQVHFIDKVVDIPVIRQRQVSVGVSGDCAESQGEKEQEEQQVSGSLVQGGEHRREEDETNAQVSGSELVQVAPNMGAGGSHPQATMDQGWDKELREIRRMIEFLVNRERKLDIKTDVAARRLERLERESSQFEDEERETSLEGALTDCTKVVKLIVDKWFVDKGYGFGRAPTGEVVFIHASVVQGAEVLVVGTEAWTQVVSDHARAEGGYRARKAWDHRAWKEEKDRERASRVAQQVRRAAALTAELAAQSESKVFEVCSHPPGLSDESLVAAGPHLVNDRPLCAVHLLWACARPQQARFR